MRIPITTKIIPQHLNI